MKTKFNAKRLTAWLLVFAMALPTVFYNGTTAEAASKAVKKVTVKVGSKNVTKKTYTLAKGKTAKLKVAVKPAKAKKAIAYKTNKKAVATVNKNGKVTAKKAGTAKITITVTGKNKKKKKTWVKIKVTNSSSNNNNNNNNNNNTGTQVTAVTVTADSPTITIGSSTMVRATLTPSTATSAITWSSNNTSVAMVDGSGSVTGIGAGTATITGTANNGVKGSCVITVIGVAVTGVTLDKSTVDLTVGATTTLTATISPSNATNKQVEWASSDPGVANVDSNGTVTGIKEGTTTVTVTTKDSGKQASATVNVTAKSTENADELSISVQNSLEGYLNTVLVGTSADILIEAKKDNLPVGNTIATISLSCISGSDIYELTTNSVTLDANGQGHTVVKLKDGYSNARPLIDNINNGSYAGLSLTVEVTGASLKETIPVSFAQILAQTELTVGSNGSALSVDNQHDVSLTPITIASAGAKPVQNTTLAKTITFSDNKNGEYEFGEEYVVSQQVSTDGIDHSVVLDAAPVLLIPETTTGESSGDYEITLPDNGFSSGEYNVYTDVNDTEKVCTLENVPGGLERLNLTFTELSLSDYSRIVVRAYVPGTNIPLTNEDGLLEDIIGSENRIGSTGKAVIPITNIFKSTDTTEKIDIKIFVQAAGQVNQDKNNGFVLVSAKGEWKQNGMINYRIERYADIVTWETDAAPDYFAEQKLNDPETYLSNVNGNSTYYWEYPTSPYIGNAIIREEQAGSNGKSIYYLNPVERDKTEDKNVPIPRNYLYEAFSATTTEVEQLKQDFTAKQENGRYIIDSKKSGIVHVKATIKIDESISYNLYSSVQWQSVKEGLETPTDEFYALAGETVEFTAHVTDVNGNPAVGISVNWYAVDSDTKIEGDTFNGLVIAKQETTTDSDAKARLVVRAVDAKNVLQRLEARVNDTNKVTLTVGTNNRPTANNIATVYWVKPGIYYQDTPEEGGQEYNTAVTDYTEPVKSSYYVGETWLIGTKIAGDILADDNRKVVGISNINIKSVAEGNFKGSNEIEYRKEIAPGIVELKSTDVGTHSETMTIDGYGGADSCLFQIMNSDDSITIHEGVGTKSEDALALARGKGLTIETTWRNTDDIKLLVDTPSGLTYDINDKYIIENNEYDVPTNYVPIYLRAVEAANESTGVAGATVDLTLNDTGVNIQKLDATTNEDGYITFYVPVPNEEITYSMTPEFQNGGDMQPFNLKFIDGTGDFTVDANGKALSAVDGEDNTFRLTFSSSVDTSTVTDPKFFEIQDAGAGTGEAVVEITSITVNDSNARQIFITTKDTTTVDNLTLTIRPSYVDDFGRTHFLLNNKDTGKLFNGGKVFSD